MTSRHFVILTGRIGTSNSTMGRGGPNGAHNETLLGSEVSDDDVGRAIDKAGKVLV